MISRRPGRPAQKAIVTTTTSTTTRTTTTITTTTTTTTTAGGLLIQKKIKKTNPENVRRTFQNFRRFCRTLPVLLRRFGPLLRRTFAPIAFLLFFHVNLSFFELLRTLPRGSQKHGPQSSQRTSQKSEKFSELLRRFSGSVFELFFVLQMDLKFEICTSEISLHATSRTKRSILAQ